MIKERVEALAGITFTGVLLNYYRDGDDSVAWHSDNDGVAGKNRIAKSTRPMKPRINLTFRVLKK